MSCCESSGEEDVEIVKKDGKRYWVCPHCDTETEIVDRVFPPEGATAFRRDHWRSRLFSSA